MATIEQIKALKIDENVFELAEDTRLEYLVHFAAPFTGAGRCVIPKGTVFAAHGPMRDDALYLNFVDGDREALLARMKAQVKIKYKDVFPRLQGFSFFITDVQIKKLPLRFRNGSVERLLEILRQLNLLRLGLRAW